MFPVLLRVFKKGIPKRSNRMIMTVLHFFPLFLTAELESEDVFSDAGTVYNPSSSRYPSSRLVPSRLLFTKTPSRSSHVCCAAPSSIRSKINRVFAKMNGCATSLFYPRCKIQKAFLAHARDVSEGHPHPCMPTSAITCKSAISRSILTRSHRDIRISEYANMRR